MKAWIRFLGSGATQLRSTVLEALQRAGIETMVHGEEAPSGLGVLVFDEAGVTTLEAVRDCRLSASTRVLVVATTGHALAGPAPAGVCCGPGPRTCSPGRGSSDPVEEIAVRLERWLRGGRARRFALRAGAPGGRAPAWFPVLQQLVEMAAFTDASVLLLGESGTGKEEVARLVHELDARAGKREFVTLDCTHGGARAVRQRVLRPRARRLHGGDERARRRLRAGGRRHALPRRGGRAAGCPCRRSCCAWCRSAPVQARGQQHLAARRLPAGLRDQP